MGFSLIVLFVLALIGLLFVAAQIRSVPQSTVAVVTMFGKYKRIMREGLNVKLPWEKVADQLSLQNRALQMEFQAITRDQANVKFSTMVVYAVANADEETIKRAVFSFASYQEFQLALQRTIDGSIRQFVATTLQADILAMRSEIVDHTKRTLDEVVSTWGYVVRDIQITDMTFDKEIMDSMARVVSSKNLLAAAANEGAALLVKRTKDAEAEAAYKTIGAEAEKKAAALRGEGLALFRRNVAEGLKEAAENLHQAGVDANFLLFLEYTDALKYVADHAQGKVIFMDNGAGATVHVAQQIASLGVEPALGTGGGPGGPGGMGGASGGLGTTSRPRPGLSGGLGGPLGAGGPTGSAPTAG
jgi:regulator of protease activity HflC (stomatin/prohibitin superfamily)